MTGGNLTIDSIEPLIGDAIKSFSKTVLDMSGAALSNVTNTKKNCNCGKKLVLTNKNQPISILSMFGKLTVVRDELFCRMYHKGHSENDEMLNLNRVHKLTKGMIEAITYASQLVPSFERASEVLKKFLHVDISSTQMQIISEEIGKEVFERQMIAANKAYEKPEETVPSILEKDKKEYVTYFGAVGEFKKFVFDAAARAGYGLLKKVVVIGDGAQWIWNMCEELFPDAVRILDYFHLSENVHGYAKAFYPVDEI
jgi:hypothetical protein